MIDESFANGQSLLHRIDPRYRVVAAILFSFVVALSYQTATLICALLVGTILIILADLKLKIVVKRLRALFGFLMLLWIVLPMTYSGPALLHIGPVDVVADGMMLSFQITVKSIAILTTFMALTATMTIATLGQALGNIGIPAKIVHLTMMTYRYLFVIEKEYQRLITAIKIRGFKPGTNIHTYRTYAYLVGMLFVRAATRAERVNKAMRCRGFQGKFYSLYTATTPTRYNDLFMIGFAVLLITLFILEIGFFGGL